MRLFPLLAGLAMALPIAAPAQLSPGPYEIIPIQDPFIIEAWYDLSQGVGQISDWTGWTGTTWTSPHAYNNHQGTDFSVGTGTPVFAVADGVVAATETTVPEATNPSGFSFGNYVRLSVDGLSPLGEQLDVYTMHLLPGAVVTPGQRVTTGQLIGYSDDTGNSTSEHTHVETLVRGGATTCGFYSGHWKYPIMFNPSGSIQVGHVVRVRAATTAIRADRLATATQISTAYKDQLYYAPYAKRGYYTVFLNSQPSNRAGWISAVDVDEVFTGTVIQPLADAGTYSHTATLAATYPIRISPGEGAPVVGTIHYGGGRFVADSASGGWYRIDVPGTAQKGWVKPDNRMIVYPKLHNPAIDPVARRNREFPIRESFSAAGPSTFGRYKFQRMEAKAFSPASPGGDGFAVFLTDVGNSGDGPYESLVVGKPDRRNYYVQADVYFNLQASLGGWNRSFLFLRDDGFGGLDQTFEGAGNCYAMSWDSDDGHLRAAKLVDGTITNFFSPSKYVTTPGWHRLRIEAENDQIRYYLDGTLQLSVTDTTFPSGMCGIGYSNHTTADPATRGAYFDNFEADVLPADRKDSVWTLF